ncbi:MAG: hypothetical protein JWN33_256 [Candidatus Saccharibacteria bacterium]|nr:hypothetical protein [Candidatus Saccharibacteria bacterium]
MEEPTPHSTEQKHDPSTTHAVVNNEPAIQKPVDAKIGKLKLAFLYVLVGGLILSALISVTAILIGEFNSVVQKALWTTVIFVTHSLLVLGLVSSDRHNQLGKSILPTTVLAATIANMFTATLGTWGLIGNEGAWKAFLVYILAIGTAYLLAAVRRLTIQHDLTKNLVLTSSVLIILLAVLLVPWIISPDASFIAPLYFRIIGAVTILAFTALSVTVIIHRIAIAQKPELRKTTPIEQPYSTSMQTVLILIGIMTAIFWLFGLSALVLDAARSTYAPSRPQYNSRYLD